MLCSFEADYSRYQRQYELAEAQQEREERQKAEEMSQEIDSALDKCDPSIKVHFFEDVEYLVNDAASENERISQAMVKALLRAAKNGEQYAIDAVALVRDHFLEVV